MNQELARFEVTVRRQVTKDGYWVRVTDRHGGDYASIGAGDIDTALRMAVPYMAAVAQPMPFDDMLERLRLEANEP